MNMKKTFASKIIDNFVLILTIFFVAFLWVRYYEHNTLLIFLYTGLITFLLCSLIHLLTNKKQKKLEISQKEAVFIENLSNFLLFSSKKQVLLEFEKTLKKRSIPYTTHSFYISFNDYILVPLYCKQTIDDEIILDTIKKLNSQKVCIKNIIICAIDFDKSAKNISKKTPEYNIKLYNQAETYLTFFKPINYELDIKPKPKQKTTFKQKLNNLSLVAFNKKRFRAYIISAIVLFVSSYFMRYNLYYLIFSSILFLFAFFSYFNKPFNKPERDIFEYQPQKEK